MNRARPRLTYANVVSTLALFVALGGGGAFAATQLAPKSVGAKQLRPGAVTADKIRKNAVTAPKLKALAVKNGKLANGAVDAPKLANAAVSGEKLANSSVSTEKLAAAAVTGDKVDESSLGQVPTANSANTAAVTTFVKIGGTGSCPAPEVQTFDAGSRVKEPFYVVLYR